MSENSRAEDDGSSPSFEEHRIHFLQLLGLTPTPRKNNSNQHNTSTPVPATRALWTFVDSTTTTAEAADALSSERRRSAMKKRIASRTQRGDANAAASPAASPSEPSPDEWRRTEDSDDDDNDQDDEAAEIIYLAETFDEPCNVRAVENIVNRRVERLMKPRTPKQSAAKRARLLLSPPSSAGLNRRQNVLLGTNAGKNNKAAVVTPGTKGENADKKQPQQQRAPAPTGTIRSLTFRSPSRWKNTTSFDIHAFLPADTEINFAALEAEAEGGVGGGAMPSHLVTSREDAIERALRDGRGASAGLAAAGLDSSDEDDNHGKNSRGASELTSIDPSSQINLLEVSKLMCESASVIRSLVKALQIQRDGTARGVPSELPKAEALIALLSRRYSNELLQLNQPNSSQQQQNQQQQAMRSASDFSASQASGGAPPPGSGTQRATSARQRAAAKAGILPQQSGGFTFSSARQAPPPVAAAAVPAAAARSSTTGSQLNVVAARPRRNSTTSSLNNSITSMNSKSNNNAALTSQNLNNSSSNLVSIGQQQQVDEGFGAVLDSASSSEVSGALPSAANPRSSQQQQQQHQSPSMNNSFDLDSAAAAEIIAALRQQNAQLRDSLDAVTKERDEMSRQLGEAVKELVGTDNASLDNGSKIRAACSGAIQSLMAQVKSLSERNQKLEARLHRVLQENADKAAEAAAAVSSPAKPQRIVAAPVSISVTPQRSTSDLSSFQAFEGAAVAEPDPPPPPPPPIVISPAPASVTASVARNSTTTAAGASKSKSLAASAARSPMAARPENRSSTQSPVAAAASPDPVASAAAPRGRVSPPQVTTTASSLTAPGLRKAQSTVSSLRPRTLFR